MLWVWLLAYLHGHFTVVCGTLPYRVCGATNILSIELRRAITVPPYLFFRQPPTFMRDYSYFLGLQQRQTQGVLLGKFVFHTD